MSNSEKEPAAEQGGIEQARAALGDWRERAVAAGWLPEHSGQALLQNDAGDATELFSGLQQRPLVVAFFGGTGVGKSSLLNRLAGAEVAKVGVIRPTSREVTVHAHESLSLAQLPAGIPRDQVQLSSHSDSASRHIIWIDTPDVDSVATQHREQVVAWLPYVDLVIYVVSPERYKDEAGWRMLREAGDKHGWMFVLNQWDRGQPEQLDDFKQVLKASGFEQPLVFCTDCRSNATEDQFSQLQRAVQTLGESTNVQALARQARAAQAQRLRDSVADCLQALGDADAVQTSLVEFDTACAQRGEQVAADLAWQIRSTADRFQHEGGGWRRLFSATAAPALLSGSDAPTAWHARAEQQLDDLIAELLVSLGQRALPVPPARLALQSVADNAGEQVKARQRELASEALQRPGTRWQQWVFRAAALLAGLAPLAALFWVGQRVITAFYRGNTQMGGYLGIDFAINSLLLVGIAWLLPALLRERLRPSLSASVSQALQQGIHAGVADLNKEIKRALQSYDNEREEWRHEAAAVIAALPGSDDVPVAALRSLRPVTQTD